MADCEFGPVELILAAFDADSPSPDESVRNPAPVVNAVVLAATAPAE